jgi:hypothetical protein
MPKEYNKLQQQLRAIAVEPTANLGGKRPRGLLECVTRVSIRANSCRRGSLFHGFSNYCRYDKGGGS